MPTRQMRRLRLTGLVLTGCVGLGLLGAGNALAETVSFTKAECSNWSVPSGVHELTVIAVGGAGQTATETEPGAGGNGDEVPATVEVTPKENSWMYVSGRVQDRAGKRFPGAKPAAATAGVPQAWREAAASLSRCWLRVAVAAEVHGRTGWAPARAVPAERPACPPAAPAASWAVAPPPTVKAPDTEATVPKDLALLTFPTKMWRLAPVAVAAAAMSAVVVEVKVAVAQEAPTSAAAPA